MSHPIEHSRNVVHRSLGLPTLLLLFSSVLASVADAAGPLVLDRDITGELTLPKTRQPHRITRNITIRPTARLKIERGTRIAVDPGVWVTLMASIEVIGDGEDRVLFGPSNRQAGWGGLMVAEKAEIELSDLTIALAECGLWNWSKRNQWAESRVTVRDSIITHCKTGVWLVRTSRRDGWDSFISWVVADCRESDALMQSDSDLMFTRCRVLRGGRCGVYRADLNKVEITAAVFAGNDVALTTRSCETPVTGSS